MNLLEDSILVAKFPNNNFISVAGNWNRGPNRNTIIGSYYFKSAKLCHVFSDIRLLLEYQMHSYHHSIFAFHIYVIAAKKPMFLITPFFY